MNQKNDHLDNLQIIDYLKDLDQRISRIEMKLSIGSQFSKDSGLAVKDAGVRKEESDFHVGEYWFANLGIIVLAIFFLFLILKPYEGINQFLPTAFGYVAVFGLVALSMFWRESFGVMSQYLFGSGLLVLFISTLRLFYFTPNPALENKILEAALLLIISLGIVLLSLKRNSVYLNLLGLLLLCASSLFIGYSYAVFIILAIVSALSVYFYKTSKFVQIPYLLFGIFITYFTHLLWALSNPFFSNQLIIVSEPKANLLFLIIYMVIYSFSLLNKNGETNEGLEVSISFINVIGCYILFFIINYFGFAESIFIYHVLFSVVALFLANLYWVKSKSKYSTYIYSFTSFASLSIAFLAAIDSPTVFIPLIWQSVIVIAFGIYFHSKSIVASNFGIFFIIFLAYLLSADTYNYASVSFGIIALISARLLNWQRDRLTLKTEFMRNIYLFIAFFSIPYMLIKSFPMEYIGISLIILASIYYFLSIILKTYKYRWMAHFTLLGTMVYVFAFALSELDITFQIITLLALSITLIAVSIFFTKMRINSNTNKSIEVE
ncbi:MAG: hypothetical protein KJ799_03940 [Bacteroidetes bacterium]|nr:hypothetical protein [Bacteroidota bacterium]MBU2505859.1 hypothetical protein [Bacteroidota bacterium]